MYTVKGVRSHMGMDGVATYCNVYRDGKRVCEFIDEGSGGEPIVRFINQDEENAAKNFCFNAETDVAVRENAQKYGWRGAWDIFVEDLCNDYDKAKEQKRFLKKLEKATWFRVKGQKYGKGEWVAIKVPFSPEVHERLKAKYGDKLGQILNLKPELAHT